MIPFQRLQHVLRIGTVVKRQLEVVVPAGCMRAHVKRRERVAVGVVLDPVIRIEQTP